jgi:hypothetical protein
MLRHLIATVAALTVTAALAPSAHAYTRFIFDTELGAPARVAVDSAYAFTRLEITRGNVVVKHAAADELEISGLVDGDVATLYNGMTPVASATYEALPVINETACVGRSAFNVRRAPGTVIVDAGAYEGYYARINSVWTAAESATVTLERPLRAGDLAYALTSEIIGETLEILSHRAVPVNECPLPPAPPPPDEATAAPPPPPPPAAPSTEQQLLAVKGSVGATGSTLRTLRLPRLAKRTSVVLPFAFPEPGTVTLELLAKGKPIGSGTKSSTANGKVSVSVKLTTAGRKLFKRTKKKLKVTVKGTFTPSRVGGNALGTAVTVTLKR